ncbi:phasin family protein [Aureimonas frigidaquae]|uniref:Phasin domain-containing protein n=1 Tax=Aureimonas frigidaquae TaxID=424757 RepID=A0A0P0Z2Z3_9HYPH|nr:phasin family protein [Aureimonas frigidaquae]BAT28384.1 hypothetical protein [Aureimonas frigidaquae]
MQFFDDTNRFGKEAVDGAMKSVSAVTKGFQQIAVEAGDYTKRSYEQSAQHFEKLAQVRTLDKVIELQSDYAKTAYEAWLSQATRMGEIFSDIAKESYKPLEAAFPNVARPDLNRTV